MNTTKFVSTLVAALLFFLTFAGCNQGGLPGLVAGKGQVFYDGTPLSGATVTFLPSQGLADGRRSAVSVTDAEGRFHLRTLNPGDGILPGDYIITVVKTKEPPPISDEEKEKILMGQARPPVPNMKAEHLIAEKYASEKTTDLKHNIGSKGDKNIKLELSSQ